MSRTDVRYAYLPANEVTAEHIVGTLCASLDEVSVASDGTAVLRFEGAVPRGLYGRPTRTREQHLAWVRAWAEEHWK